jgi:hypothetical protein
MFYPAFTVPSPGPDPHLPSARLALAAPAVARGLECRGVAGGGAVGRWAAALALPQEDPQPAHPAAASRRCTYTSIQYYRLASEQGILECTVTVDCRGQARLYLQLFLYVNGRSKALRKAEGVEVGISILYEPRLYHVLG